MGDCMKEDPDIIKELFQFIQRCTSVEVTEEKLKEFENKISEKLEKPDIFNINILEKAILMIKESAKEPKFIFKNSDLKKN